MGLETGRPILVVAGVGNGSGTGAATAKMFAKEGYRVALIGRDTDHLTKVADGINSAGGEAVPLPIAEYNTASLTSAFKSISSQWPDSRLRVAVWNTVHFVMKPFLQTTDEDIAESLNINVCAAFAFSRLVITAFKENGLNEAGKRGTLIFTGALSGVRGTNLFSAFSAGKFGLRGLSQSLNKEFGKDNIHVANALISGFILTDRTREFRNDKAWDANENARLDPESIAKSYVYLVNQDRSAWTWELDLRPAHEQW